MANPVNNPNRTRKERYTFYCPLELQAFAKSHAKKLKLRGGVSELLQRLLVAENKSKRGIAERNERTLPEGVI